LTINVTYQKKNDNLVDKNFNYSGATYLAKQEPLFMKWLKTYHKFCRCCSELKSDGLFLAPITPKLIRLLTPLLAISLLLTLTAI